MKYIITITVLLLTSCREPSNNKVAKIIQKDAQTFIQLTGKRYPLVHDPLSFLKSKLIDDTLFLNIGTFNEGRIEGNKILVDKGYYKYSGFLILTQDSLTVNLKYINIDDSILEPVFYNGRYKIIR